MTQKELAKKLNLSPAALSFVLNNKPGVSSATRQRVLSELKSMGMEHIIKTDHSPAQSQSISFIIYKHDGEILDLHPFFLLLMEYIEEQANIYGFHVLISTVDKRKPILPQIDRIKDQNSRGAIIFATEMKDTDLQVFQSLTIPLVMLDNNFSRIPCNTVSIDNEMGTYQAIEYLVQHGHTRIGYLRCTNQISSFRERYLGYTHALSHFGLALEEEDIWNIHYSEDESYRDICMLLQNKKNLPDAFVCDDDTMAIGAVRAFAAYGIRVPDDISIIGFNDRPSCDVTTPPLTSINISRKNFSTESVDELMRLIQHAENSIPESRSRKIRIGTKLIERNSVKKKN